MATDPDMGEQSARTVLATIVGSGAKSLVQITIDPTTEQDAPEWDETGSGEEPEGVPGPVSAGDVIVATDGHPFWVPDLGLWVDAVDLAPGMWLQTSTGTWVQVSAVQVWTQAATVHNLTVQGVHTFHVAAGSLDVLNHNIGGRKGGYGDACSLFHPGPYAEESIPARGKGRNWTAQETRDVNAIGDKYGCHTCGARSSGYPSGTWVKDHQPVSTFIDNDTPQILLPQCRSCSSRQGVNSRLMNIDGINPYTDF